MPDMPRRAFGNTGLEVSALGLGGGQVALLAPVETMFTILFAVIFLGDRLTLAQSFGGVFILVSAVLAVQRLRRAKVPQPDETAEIVAGAD